MYRCEVNENRSDVERARNPEIQATAFDDDGIKSTWQSITAVAPSERARAACASTNGGWTVDCIGSILQAHSYYTSTLFLSINMANIHTVDITRLKHGEVNLGVSRPGSRRSSCTADLQTSIMAVQFNGGVVIGADTRTTTGAYIVSGETWPGILSSRLGQSSH